MKKCDILIGIPCYDRKLYVETANSITGTIVELLNFKSRAAVFTLNGCALITHARNAIVSEFLSRKEKTHLLFVDSDLEWSPNTVVRLLNANVPFAAASYPLKKYFNTKVSTYNPKDLDMFHAAVQEWNVEFDDPGILTGASKLTGVHNGFAKAVRIGAGLMLLRRDMLEIMVSKYADTEYRWHERVNDSASLNRKYFGLFDLTKDEDGNPLGEDYSFCERWVRGCGGEIWCDIDARVGHHGHNRYSGSLQESLRLRSRGNS
jgi:hypothetical protein